MAFARAKESTADTLEVFVLGGGSNLLVADRGFDGLVVMVDDNSVVFDSDTSETVRVTAGAGVDWDALVVRTVAAGLGGLECLSGIPGRVGAAPIQNVGAYGQEVAETIEAVDVLELQTGETRRLEASACRFAYRWSRFKDEWRGRYVVLRVVFRLERVAHGTVRYPELARRLGVADSDPRPGVTEVREAVLEIRRSKGMLIEGDNNADTRSAGSFFVNPVVSEDTAERVRRRLDDADLPTYAVGPGRVKIPAAWLIERAGFHRGHRRGQAAISSHHALALTTTGDATAAEVVALAGEIRRGVRDACGIVLMPEPVFLGFDDDIDVLLCLD